MTKAKKTKSPFTDALRKAVADSELPLLAIERETGVPRASIMRFMRGERTLRLDMADKLAAYFNLLVSDRKGK